MAKHIEDHPEHVEGCYACKLTGVRFGGLYSFKLHRENGTTEAGMFKENVKEFKKRKGYEPYTTSERWI